MRYSTRPTARSGRSARVNDDAPIDLRSDTVTKPSKQMRTAMATAEVGDDVLDGDPTMAELQERVANLLGVQAALWVPSGSMGNLIALTAHLSRGDAFLAPAGAHVLDAELGTAAWLAGGMPRPMPHDAGPGRITPDAVVRAAGTPGPYYTLRTTLLCLENTHMSAGGVVTEVDEHAALAAAARSAGLKVHLDGARLWHAAIALGLPPAALTVGVDTVQVCLSKALGAPVGSVVAGTAEFVEEARRLRKMLGGGVRQGGVLAAAGLVALDNIDRLAKDHEHAAKLAEGLSDLGWRVTTPRTNIVLLTPADMPSTLRRLERANVLVGPIGGQIRFVTHGDLTNADIDNALRRIGPAEDGYATSRRLA
ncbi:MAG: aminotransferase class I/II-fold pyridoxal phosphate-dependent enzyme [Pseudonocardia sp.]|nr:aminotransferase class I/II-fold pyridoxal phosphate-dependent enzyme [Pseudonocardia sp.]